MNQLYAWALSSQWELKPLKYLFDVLNGATPSSSEPSYWDGNIYWATPEDVGSLNGKLLTDTRRKITEDGYINCGTQLAPEGSIVLTTRAPVGNLAVSAVPLCTNQGCKTLVPTLATVHQAYYYYHLLARKQELQTLATGTTFYELGSDELRAFKLLSPSFEEQRAIADMLDRETAKLDELIREKERLLELLDEKRQAIITRAVTRGLNDNAQLRDSALQWLGEIPMHWKTMHLKRVLVSLDYGISESVNREGNIVVLRMGDIRDGEISFDNTGFVNEVEQSLLLNPGDLVFNRTNSLDQVGKVGLFRGYSEHPVTFASYLVRLRCSEKIIPTFLNYLLNSYPVLTWAKSEALPAIGQVNLNPHRYSFLPIALPPLEEQFAIVDYINSETKKLDALRDVTMYTISLLKERRAALIAAAVTGQIFC